MFLSITLLEASVILVLLYLLYETYRERELHGGSLSAGIGLFSSTTVISTLLYQPGRLGKGLEEGLFQVVYFLRISRREALSLAGKYELLLTAAFFVLLPYSLYRYFREGEVKPLWGGTFEAGFFFSLFGLSFFLFGVREERIKLRLLCFFLSLLSFSVVFLTHRRSMILASVVLFFLLLFILYRSGRLRGLLLGASAGVFLLLGAGGYYYLSQKDVRFKVLNEMLLGKRPVNERNLNVISSARYSLMKQGIETLKRDLKEGEFLKLLIGRGPMKRRYESVFLLSELVERGVIGLLGILLVYIGFFRDFFSLRLAGREDYYRLLLMLPLGIHLLQTVFTYFWDAMLPAYLLLFRASEALRGQRSL